MEITDEMELQIKTVTTIITNPEDRQDAIQYLKLKLLNQDETIETTKILLRFLYDRLMWFLIVNKAQGLTFNGAPTTYEKANHNHLPKPEYVKLPKQLADNRVISSKKKVRKLVIWIIETWLKQC